MKKTFAVGAMLAAAMALTAVRAEETTLPEFDASTLTGDQSLPSWTP